VRSSSSLRSLFIECVVRLLLQPSGGFGIPNREHCFKKVRRRARIGRPGGSLSQNWVLKSQSQDHQQSS
jgi:hypothetical protein